MMRSRSTAPDLRSTLTSLTSGGETNNKAWDGGVERKKERKRRGFRKEHPNGSMYIEHSSECMHSANVDWCNHIMLLGLRDEMRSIDCHAILDELGQSIHLVSESF